MSHGGYYILDKDHHAVKADLLTWARWFEQIDKRIVKQTKLDPGDILVSTVFLGLDHSFTRKGPPILFETMVFGLNEENEAMMQRYSSWDDAATGHAVTVRKVKEMLAKIDMPKIPTKRTKA